MTIESELNTIMPGEAPLTNLEARRTGYVEYMILDVRNGHPSVERVNLGKPACSCGGTTPETNDICNHYVQAFMTAKDVSADDLLMEDMASMISAAYEARDAAETAEEIMQDATVDAREAQATAVAEQPDETESIEDKLGRLEEALNEHDFTVNEIHTADTDEYGTQIEFEVYHDNFDLLKACTSNFDTVAYTGDVNAVDPGDVDALIDRIETKAGEML